MTTEALVMPYVADRAHMSDAALAYRACADLITLQERLGRSRSKALSSMIDRLSKYARMLDEVERQKRQVRESTP